MTGAWCVVIGYTIIMYNLFWCKLSIFDSADIISVFSAFSLPAPASTHANKVYHRDPFGTPEGKRAEYDKIV